MEFTRSTIRHLSNLGCTGLESRLVDCSHEGIGVHTCGLNSYENAAVECQGGIIILFITHYAKHLVWHIITAPPQATTFHEGIELSTVTTSALMTSKNISSLTSSAGAIIAGSISSVTVLLTMVVLVFVAVVFIIRRKAPYFKPKKTRYLIWYHSSKTAYYFRESYREMIAYDHHLLYLTQCVRR